mgnify:CR=1 FL=1
MWAGTPPSPGEAAPATIHRTSMTDLLEHVPWQPESLHPLRVALRRDLTVIYQLPPTEGRLSAPPGPKTGSGTTWAGVSPWRGPGVD